jgi:hypothetical protein
MDFFAFNFHTFWLKTAENGEDLCHKGPAKQPQNLFGVFSGGYGCLE